MAKYLKLFETSAEYQQFIGGGGDFLRPNVSLVNDTNSLFYNPLEKELPYLTITALEDDFKIEVIANYYTPQYSLNGTEWFEVENNMSPTINTGDKIYFKGILEQGNSSDAYFFTTEQRFNLSGNCMSMVFSDEAEGKTDLTGFDACFAFMFNSCTGLVSISKNFLPATTLADNCYDGMFAGCTSLVAAPELPATTLAGYCYGGMFMDCTSLNYIKMLATDISADSCLGGWVSNVSATGTFVKSKDATWNVTGINGIPEGWTVETA